MITRRALVFAGTAGLFVASLDEIRGAIDGKPWSIRSMLRYSLKN